MNTPATPSSPIQLHSSSVSGPSQRSRLFPSPAREVWHEGERALQARAGVAGRMAEIGPQVIRDHMPDQHRRFFAQLPFLLVGSVDAAGQPWASVLAAPAGFAQAPDAHRLRIDARPAASDPLAATLAPGAQIGLLGIEPHTRRRNRMNGVVDAVDAQGFSVAVHQSFGNCPKYIQARKPVFVDRAASPAVPRRDDHLDDAALRVLRNADTFFIATAHPDLGDGAGVDVSHRGGRPGFVGVSPDGTLTVPDFVGNSFFNTLGNIASYPRAGLLFIDFDTGDLLQIAVSAEIVWNASEVAAFPGAQRLLRMKVATALFARCALPLRWGPAEVSPHLEGTGRWPGTV